MKKLYFILGTQAELMKIFPVINAARNRGYDCKVIATGQNDLYSCPYLAKAHAEVDIDITARAAKSKSTSNYMGWFLNTALHGRKILKSYFTAEQREKALCVVHGDTLTTAMGAWICKSLKLPYVHIESGPRSFNFLSPFPEEFDRLYGSMHSVMNFCPGQIHADYAAKKFRGKAVNTVYNTGIETLYDAINENGDSCHPAQPKEPYFMFMLHRQENIMRPAFIKCVAQKIAEAANEMPCVFIYHEQTKSRMEAAGVFNLLAEHPNVTLMPRQSYTNFICLVCHAEFIATDGCGNQQEFYYLGKPYLILRTAVEKDTEGLGWNAKVFNNDFEEIPRFVSEYHLYEKPRVVPTILPSTIIMDSIDCWFGASATHSKQQGVQP